MITPATVRESMRIKHNSLDTEIQNNIDACLLDLERVGVNRYMNNGLIDKACELYCKWQFNYMGKGEQFEKNYEKLRDSLSLSGDYIVR